ncbi:MAG: CAP domain-containing protein [Actinomycetota bacterium]
MQPRTRIARITLFALVAILMLQVIPSHAGPSGDRRRERMYRATNVSRTNHEVRKVDLIARISDLARRHSLKMARNSDLFHTKDPAATYLEGVRWHTWGENVGVTGGSVADLQAAFMRSSGHRANILNPAFDNVAVGAVRRDGILWVTVVFWG